MARALARSTASSVANPVLDLWTLVAGALADVETAEFQVFDVSDDAKFSVPVQVYPALAGTKQAATRLSTGRYVAAWTPGGAEPLGRHRLVWTLLDEAGGDPREQVYDFDVLAAGLALQQPAYVLLSELRDEGVATATLSDRKALQLINVVSRRIERWTRRFFEARRLVLPLDGAAGASQFLDAPVIALESAAIDSDAVDAETFKVFNRHLTSGLMSPDDRASSRVTFGFLRRYVTRINSDDRPWGNRAIWWPGVQNVTLTGLFGFTDPSPFLDVGATPLDIMRLAVMLVVRDQVALGDTEGRFDHQAIGRVKSVSTADQSISYGSSASSAGPSAGAFTGDPEIDEILCAYSVPMGIGGV
jgi:hypothetical protein